ncbi:MAG: DinB family protein [Phycisphaerae bacterium]
MDSSASPSFIERFRHWYDYERDCNAKSLQMLQSVPDESRASPQFARAVGKLAHLIAARHMWLHRLGAVADRPESWFPPTTLEQLPALVDAIQRRWTDYLAALSDADLAADFTCAGGDGKRYRWRLIDLLTQVFGHAWYHRGQIAMLVKDLGGDAVDTDYIFWDRPSVVSEIG